MKLEVEIDLTDEQWAEIRLWARPGASDGWFKSSVSKALIVAYDAQRPIQVGDRTRGAKKVAAV